MEDIDKQARALWEKTHREINQRKSKMRILRTSDEAFSTSSPPSPHKLATMGTIIEGLDFMKPTYQEELKSPFDVKME